MTHCFGVGNGFVSEEVEKKIKSYTCINTILSFHCILKSIAQNTKWHL